MFIPFVESLVSQEQPTSCLLSSIVKRDVIGTADCRHHHSPKNWSSKMNFTD